MTKRKEIGLYIVFGVLTTLVHFIVFEGLQWVLRPRWGMSYLFSNLVAFIAALIFAFVVNKLFVFEKKSWAPREVAWEIATFTGARVFSFVLETVLMTLFFELIWRRAEDWFTPLWLELPLTGYLPGDYSTPEYGYQFIIRWGFIAVLVVVLNYVFAKWVVFKKKEEPDEADIVEC